MCRTGGTHRHPKPLTVSPSRHGHDRNLVKITVPKPSNAGQVSRFALSAVTLRLWCQLLVVIVYSSAMIGICTELSGSVRISEVIRHAAAQAITGMNGLSSCDDLFAAVLELIFGEAIAEVEAPSPPLHRSP